MSKGIAQGFTLTEALTCVAIAGIVMTMAIPSMKAMSEKIHTTNESSQLHQAISLARSQAFTNRTRITICPLSSSHECDDDWNLPLSIFTDLDNNRKLNDDERLLAEIAANDDPLVLRHFNSKVISFDERGFAGFNTGSLSLCRSGEIISGRVFIISRNGRIRPGRDKNKDGIPETPNGKNIPCPKQLSH